VTGDVREPAAALAGVPSAQNVLDPAGIQAERIADFWWFAFAIAAVVFVLVIGAMLYATFHRRRSEADDPQVEAAKSRTMNRWVVGAVAATVVILLVYLVTDFLLGRAVASLTDGVAEDDVLTIEVTGHQWWWEVKYPGDPPSRAVTTANEIHVPVGRPVRLKMRSGDVIHSFWVPNLHGKKDLIPGHQTVTEFRADRPGVYRGECAEFCGHQHAKMGLLVIAEPPERFAAWYERQLRPAPPPADSVRARGQEVFLAHACVMCHTIRGTPAGGKVAPELTHLASRRTIAAATLPNTRGHLGGWITNSQRIKPGNHMPPNQIAPDDLQALLTYLQSLK
jgi:cytochrome c oxidase subunit 2